MSHPEPTTLRRPERRLELLLFVLVGLTAVGFVLHLVALPWVTLALSVVLAVELVRPLGERLVVGLTGVEGRRLLGHVRIAWPDVWGITERRGLMHRRVVVVTDHGNRRQLLPVLRGPRQGSPAFDAGVAQLSEWSQRMGGPAVSPEARKRGLAGRLIPILATVLCLAAWSADRPWYWVAGAEAVVAPDACAFLTAEFGQDAQLAPAPSRANDRPGSACSVHIDQGTVDITFSVYGRERLMSGTGVAADAFRHEQGLIWQMDMIVARGGRGPAVETIDVADDAVVIGAANVAFVLARRANVLVTISHDGGREAGIALATKASTAVVLN